jgi:hypothetical protein
MPGTQSAAGGAAGSLAFIKRGDIVFSAFTRLRSGLRFNDADLNDIGLVPRNLDFYAVRLPLFHGKTLPDPCAPPLWGESRKIGRRTASGPYPTSDGAILLSTLTYRLLNIGL